MSRTTLARFEGQAGVVIEIASCDPDRCDGQHYLMLISMIGVEGGYELQIEDGKEETTAYQQAKVVATALRAITAIPVFTPTLDPSRVYH